MKIFTSILSTIKKVCKRSLRKSFISSEDYWIKRYEQGGNSGPGSYNRLAKFKAKVINAFVKENNVFNVIEYGCGDGNQLRLAEYPSYTGFDVSLKAVDSCRKAFSHDKSKTFKLLDDYQGESACLTLSLDVIYHLVEDDVYLAYMNRLFSSSEKFVIIYSSNFNSNPGTTMPHVRHRAVTSWVETHKPNWHLLKHIPNQYPFKGNVREESHADFFIYERKK